MRRKKNKTEFIKSLIGDNLIRISFRTGTDLNTLRSLNPDIRFAGLQLMLGRKVRIK